MLQIRNLTIRHRKDLREIIKEFNLVLNNGDKAVIIGEEGNGKSTLMKWIYKPELILDYTDCEGKIIKGNERLGYLPQELEEKDKGKTLYEFFSQNEEFWNQTPQELAMLANRFGLSSEFFYSEQIMGSLSGGEKVKAQLMRLLFQKVTVLLLDEPSNDIDIETLEILENIINSWEYIVLYISHDETLIENTANMIIHIEQIQRKTRTRHSVARLSYQKYMANRKNMYQHQKQLAMNDRKEKRLRDEKYRRVMQSVEHAQNAVSRQNPSEAKNLKDKMHAVKAMGRRFEKVDENMTAMPEQEEAIFFKLADKESAIPAGKNIIKYELPELWTENHERILAKDIKLSIRGPEKICIVGTNGAGKTTLLRKIAENLLQRRDIRVEYMPQNYEEMLDLDITPVEYLNRTGDKAETTRIRTYLGSMKYTADEMEHPIRELSGGQKAKVLLLKMSLSKANVLILDEPTRNFSPLSGPVIRQMIREFPGAVICISHDRKFIEEVCDTRYELTSSGLNIVQTKL